MSRHLQWAVVLWMGGLGLAVTLWVIYGTGAFVLAGFAGLLDNLARARFDEARRQEGLGEG